jgi:ribosomal protein S18 acetylase RimI-like enzyme
LKEKINEMKSKDDNGLNETTRQDKSLRITFATLDDVDALVTLHYKCFTKKDHIALRFGKPFIVATYKWFITSPGTFVVIAEDGNSLVGFQTVADRPYDGPMLRASWREAFIGFISHPWVVFDPELLGRLWRLLFRRIKNTPGNDQEAQLAFVGVDPQARGRGIGKALVVAAVQACHKRGLNLITTGVMRQNIRSLAMLESAGFVEVPELGTKRFIRLRLRFDLDNMAPNSNTEKRH